MNIYIVSNQSPWGDDRNVSATFKSKDVAEAHAAALNASGVSEAYAWQVEAYTLSSARDSKRIVADYVKAYA